MNESILIALDVQAVRGIECHAHQRGTVEIDMSPAQMGNAFEALYAAAPDATKEAMRDFIAEQPVARCYDQAERAAPFFFTDTGDAIA